MLTEKLYRINVATEGPREVEYEALFLVQPSADELTECIAEVAREWESKAKGSGEGDLTDEFLSGEAGDKAADLRRLIEVVNSAGDLKFPSEYDESVGNNVTVAGVYIGLIHITQIKAYNRKG